jgi:3-methyladenine DNA glycosylase AlkD
MPSTPMREQSVKGLAAQLNEQLNSQPDNATANLRRIRKEFSQRYAYLLPDDILALADRLITHHGLRWIAYELIADHKGAYLRLSTAWLERLGRGLNSWQSVDSFARTLSGPAWRDGLISDDTIRRWAGSHDRWWRRASLVSTVALNMRSYGGPGDTRRTLDICGRLLDDPDDMVVKAMSWALRELVPHDPGAVREFLALHKGRLARRVMREVTHKLETGLKHPRRRSSARPAF